MRIRIARHTVVLNRIVMAGEVLDESVGLSEKDAIELIRLGKAVEVTVKDADTAPVNGAGEAVEIQAAGLETADDEAAAADPGQAGDNPRPTPLAWAAETAIEAAGLTTETAGSLVKKVKGRLSRKPKA
ncbi:MAG: hypothetical protein MUC33_01375 [Desulfobacterales bacterium]|nr:hypothetical protein [Desulfobacterales bacterium]